MDQGPPVDPFEAEFRKQLERGERLLWHGSARKPAVRRGCGQFGFAVIWTAFSLFWTGAAYLFTRAAPQQDSMAFWFPFFGIPFILIGLVMLVAPFLGRAAASKTGFAITDQRVIRMLLGTGVMSESIAVAEITGIERVALDDAGGSLVLQTIQRSAAGGPSRSIGFTLGEVDDIATAERRLREAMRAAKPVNP